MPPIGYVAAKYTTQGTGPAVSPVSPVSLPTSLRGPPLLSSCSCPYHTLCLSDPPPSTAENEGEEIGRGSKRDK